jgi:hypothetical protein
LFCKNPLTLARFSETREESGSITMPALNRKTPHNFPKMAENKGFTGADEAGWA